MNLSAGIIEFAPYVWLIFTNNVDSRGLDCEICLNSSYGGISSIIQYRDSTYILTTVVLAVVVDDFTVGNFGSSPPPPPRAVADCTGPGLSNCYEYGSIRMS